jgi:Family of unknown function (DUF5317)
MLLVLLALVLGVLIGLALGGRVGRIADIRLRWWGLAFLGLALQLIPISSGPGQLDHWLAVGLLVGSYLVLLVFVAANIRRAGFALVAMGFALNALVISLNGGMPVSSHALHVAAGPYYQETRERLTEHGGEKHHLRRPGDVLVELADVIPVGSPVRQVLSAGDVLWLMGTSWVIAGAMGRRHAGRRTLPQEGERGSAGAMA